MEKEAWVVKESKATRCACVIFAIPPVRVVGHVPCLEREKEVLLPNNLNLNLQVGDRVAVEMKGEHFLWASLLMYGVPLLFFSLATRSGRFTPAVAADRMRRSRWDRGRPVISLLSYKGINLCDRRLQASDRYQLYVTRVLSRAVRKGKSLHRIAGLADFR